MPPERPNGITLREYVDLRLEYLERTTAKTEARLDSLELTRATLAGKASRGQWIAAVALLVAAAGLLVQILKFMEVTP